MRFGLQLHGEMAPDAYPRLAARAEELGFEDVTLHDVLLRRPVWPVLIDIARATERVLVGPNVTHPYLQHPVLIAANLRHLQEISGGRAVCGIGRGSMYELVGWENPATLAGLEEAVAVIRALLRGETGGIEGSTFSLRADAELRFGVPSEVPIYLGTLGPKGAALAGRIGQGLRAAAQWEPSYAATLRDAAHTSALDHGRSSADCDVIAENWTFVHSDRDRARHEARILLANFLPHLGPLLRHHDVPSVEVEAAEDIARFHRMDRVLEISDRTVDLFMAAGDVDDLVVGIRALDAAGLDAVSFSGALGPDTDLAVELIGDAITRVRDGLDRAVP
jgi:5,10-methylenetetrahydromethanopterin reductase